MSAGKFSDPLQDYFDSLLSDAPLSDTQFNDTKSNTQSSNTESVESNRLADDSALKLAAGGNVAALPSTPRPARVVPARPYAEPVRTLNLRMPLPPIAPVVESVSVAEMVVVAETAVAPVVETELRVAAKALEIAPQVPPPEVIVPVVETQPVAVTEAQSVTETQNNNHFAAMEPPAAWLPNGRPQWAQQPFECLIFKAGGLQLAAPLIELGSIYPLDDDGLTAIFGQTHWFMGLLPVKEYNVRAMDTALVVMPERYSAAMRENYRYIVTLFGSDWGLAVDAVVGTVTLNPEHIRWRGERSKRPWLAGTLVDQMCALFDIAQLAWLFHNQDRKRVPA